jgi:hypothetical protein
MSNKNSNLPDKPIVSRVPLPISDSALVIDLPDGQKLVIGKMSEGTVIEVATWRGVGRPDSRTNRMMFGMSSAEIEEEAGPVQEESALASTAGAAIRVVGYPLAMLKWLLNIQTKPKVKKRKDGRKNLIIDAKAPGVQDSTNADLSVVKVSSTSNGVIQILKKSLPVVQGYLHRGSLKLLKSIQNFDLQKTITALRSLKFKLAIGSRPGKKVSSSTALVSKREEMDIDQWLASITDKASKSTKTSQYGQGHVAIRSDQTAAKKTSNKTVKKGGK